MQIINTLLPEAESSKIEDYAKKFIDQAPCGFLIINQDGTILMTNDRLLSWLQHEPGELLRTSRIQDFLTEVGKPLFEDTFTPEPWSAGEVRDVTLNLARKNGSELPAQLSVTKFENTDHDGHLFSIVITNYSDRRQFERELNRARKDAEVSDRAKTTFLSNISHEVLTPLNAIIGTADLLSLTELSTHQTRLQTILLESGNHLLSLFKNILVVAKSGVGPLEVSNKAFSPRRMIESIVETYRYGTSNDGTEYQVEVGQNVPQTVLGDPALLGQVMTNLVGNAAKFSAGGKVKVILTRPGGSPEGKYRLRFCVTDDGIGISEEDQKNLLKPFGQANTSIHQKYGGAGLGLSISQTILERFDSHIELESVPDRGSRFWFDIDLGRAEAAPETTSSVADLPEINMGKVLIVEDNRTNSFLVARYFLRWKVGYDLATNGQEALDMVKANTYDLVLMDLKMPVMDGYTAARKIRKLPSPKSDVPIIAFSASARMAMTERMRDAHIDEFTLKPFDPRELHAVLLRFLAPAPMNFSELRNAMDHDPEELRSFSAILRRELNVAATELQSAFETKNVQAVADLKHKLKTTLQLLEAHTVKKDLQAVVDDLRAGRPADEGVQSVIIEELLQLSRRLARERW